MNTMMEYYLGIDPHALSDEEWAMKWKMLQHIRKEEKKASGS